MEVAPESSFSDVDLTLASIRNDKGNHLFVRLDHLFNFDPDILSFPEKRPPSMSQSIARLVSELKRCQSKDLEDRLIELRRAASNSQKVSVVDCVLVCAHAYRFIQEHVLK